MSATPLPAGVVELLQAIVDSLDVPMANDAAGDAARLRLFDRRTSHVSVLVAHLLKSKFAEAGRSAETLRAWTAEEPVTYTPWKDTHTGESTPAAQDGGQ